MSSFPPDFNRWLTYGQKLLYRLFQWTWVRRWMRLGHGAKGLLYGLIGLLAVRSIVYDDKSAGGSEAVLAILGARPLGNIVLLGLSIGLFGYSAWRLVQVLVDPENTDEVTWRQRVQRFGYAVSCLTYLGIGYTAGRLAIGLTVDFKDTAEELTEVLFEANLGPLALSAIGVGVILVGLTYMYGAFSGKFINEFQVDLYTSIKQFAVGMGKVGFTSRGLSFILIGSYLLKAAYLVDDEFAGGLGQVLDRLDDQPFGKVWLSAIAFGFIAYASYMVIAAIYRKFPNLSPKR